MKKSTLPSKKSPTAVCSPVEVFKSLSAKKQDELVSDIIMNRAIRGDASAARYLRDHKRLEVVAFWADINGADPDNTGTKGPQSVALNFSIGLVRDDSVHEWESNFLHFDVWANADENRVVRWKDWGDDRGELKVLPIFLGEWIKKPIQLKLQADDKIANLLSSKVSGTTMKLPAFIKRLKGWNQWSLTP